MRNIGIIEPIRYSTWVSNLVSVRKNNGDIRLCVDFRNVSSLKDNYALPNMEALLQKDAGNELLSMMDGFVGAQNHRLENPKPCQLLRKSN